MPGSGKKTGIELMRQRRQWSVRAASEASVDLRGRNQTGQREAQETGRSPHPLDDALLGHDVPAADADDLVDVLDERKVGSLDRALFDLCV
jgi:hypothetical protein